MLESTGFMNILLRYVNACSFLHSLAIQFTHHPWHGLHFWDLIQPGFMFIAGVAMAFSLYKQTANGIPWNKQFSKALKRSGWLFFWGVLDYAVRGDHLSFELWDVLTQLSFTLVGSVSDFSLENRLPTSIQCRFINPYRNTLSLYECSGI